MDILKIYVDISLQTHGAVILLPRFFAIFSFPKRELRDDDMMNTRL